MTDLRDQIRDFTREFESSLPVIEAEQITSENVHGLRTEPVATGSRRLLPTIAAVVAIIAVVALALLTGGTPPEVPVVSEPDPPTTSVPDTTPTSVEAEESLTRAEVLDAVERYVGALNDGNDDLLFELMGDVEEHPDLSGLLGEEFAGISEDLISVARRMALELSQCEIVEDADDLPRGLDELVDLVRCSVRLHDPIYTAINGDRIHEWEFLVDSHGHVHPPDVDAVRGGDFVMARRAFVEYALIHVPAEFETACFPGGDMPEGEVWRVQRELRLYMPPDCRELYGELAEEVAAWYEAGEAENIRRR